jgi:hypothetical protein
MGWKFGEFNILMGFEICIREIKGKILFSLDCLFWSLPNTNTNLAKFQKTRSEVRIQNRIQIKELSPKL